MKTRHASSEPDSRSNPEKFGQTSDQEVKSPHGTDPEARLAELQAIARNVALDANLKVQLGREGVGSFCAYGRPSSARISRGERSITIDPNHILDPAGDFIVAHEGAHAHTTFSPFDGDLRGALARVVDPEKLHKEIGTGSLLNYLEDCGMNSWLFKSYPGFKESGKQLYDRMLHIENPTMATPEVNAVTAQIGFFPRFAQFGSEVMKKWWTGDYSKAVDPDVVKALDRHENDIKKYIDTFAPGQAADLRIRQAKWMERYLVGVLTIYPTIKALVAKDLDQAAKQQVANQLQQFGKEEPPPGSPGGGEMPQQGHGQQPGQQGQQPGSPGGVMIFRPGQGQGSGQHQQPGQLGAPGTHGSSQEGDDNSASSNPGGALQRKVQHEINRRAAEHQKNLRQNLKKELDDLERHLDGKSAESSGEGETSEEDLSKKIDALKKKVAERFDDPGAEEQRKALERQLEAFKKLNEAVKEQSAPVDTLSQEAQKAIEQEFKKLSAAEREALRNKAKELLEELEDKIRESMESELQENAPEKHGDRRRAQEILKAAQKRDEKLSADIEKMRAEREAMLGEWDKLRQSIAPQVNVLFSRLERLLRPSIPEWDSGHASGQRVNPFAVMQAEADRKLATKIWEKTSLPAERDFIFSLLVDVSGSMSGEKAQRAAECAVLMSEVLTRLKIPFEIATFNDSARVIKRFEKNPAREGKNEIARQLLGVMGGTNDFLAVHERIEGMVGRSEENKFLIVVTDGGSANPPSLVRELNSALKSNIRVIGLGIGQGTSDVDRYYPIGRGGLSINSNNKEHALGPYFAKTLEKILTNPEQFVREALRKKGGENGSNNGA